MFTVLPEGDTLDRIRSRKTPNAVHTGCLTSICKIYAASLGIKVHNWLHFWLEIYKLCCVIESQQLQLVQLLPLFCDPACLKKKEKNPVAFCLKRTRNLLSAPLKLFDSWLWYKFTVSKNLLKLWRKWIWHADFSQWVGGLDLKI